MVLTLMAVSVAEQVTVDVQGLLGQFQCPLRVAQRIGVIGDAQERRGGIGMALAVEVTVDGERLACHVECVLLGLPRA